MSVTLNGVSRKYKPGLTIKEKLNADLDEGMVIFTDTESLSIQPFDEVVISIGDFDKNMLVSDIWRITVSYNTPKEYNYQTWLTSPTIQLQRIVLPNRTITQPISGTKTSIYEVMSNYVSIYAPDFTISSELQTLTTNVDCPELQWNRPTLYEVFNDLLSEVDCVVTMKEFDVITYLDLNVVGDDISDVRFTDITLNQNAQDYANKIECEVENAIVNKRNTTVVEWVSVKTDDDALLTTSNAKIILEHTIDKINSILISYPIDGYSTVPLTGTDITSYLLEKMAYDLTKHSNSLGTVTGNLRRNRIYYEKGSNKIEGLTYDESTWIGITSDKAIINISKNAGLSAYGNSDITRIFMRVEYQTQDTVKFISNKTTSYASLTTQTPNTLINNQETSYVDFNAFARKQQFTANRLANAYLELKGKFTTGVPDLGDYYEDYKVAVRELSIDGNFINFKGTASENYVLQDMFTGIKTQRRYTSIATGSESLECNHIQELNFNLSKQGNEVFMNSETLDTTLENYVLRFAEADENIKLIQFNTDQSDDIGVTPSVYYTDKNILITWRMADNYSAGLSLDDTDDLLHNYVPYVDDDGNFDYYSYKLYKGYDWQSEYPASVFQLHWIRLLPELNTNLLDSNDLIYASGNIYRYKDNREITIETLQFNFSTGSNVFYGKKFFSDSPICYTETTDTTLYVAYSETETYEEGDQEIKGTIASASSLTYTKSSNKITITSPDSSIVVDDLASWAICDVSGNIYISANN